MKKCLYLLCVLFVIPLIAFWGCEKKTGNSAPPVVQEIEVDTLMVFASYDDHGITRPSKITVFNSGDVAVSDIQQNNVSVISQSGNLKFKMGREGRGPGEFTNIHYIYDTDQTITVVDRQQYMASRFDHSGEFLNSYPLDTRGISSETTIVEDSIYVAGGEDGKLLKVVDLKQDSTLLFGEQKTMQPESIDLQQSLSQLKGGEIPDFFKNQFTVRSDGEHIYAYLNSYSDLRKYTRSGKLVWEKHVDLPYNQVLYDQLMEISKTVSNGVPVLMYILDFNVIDDSIFFLSYLPSREDPQVLVRTNSEGEIDAIYTLPTTYGYASGFDIDPQTGIMYFANTDYVTFTAIN